MFYLCYVMSSMRCRRFNFPSVMYVHKSYLCWLDALWKNFINLYSAISYTLIKVINSVGDLERSKMDKFLFLFFLLTFLGPTLTLL